MLEKHGYDAPEHLKIVESVWICARIVGQEEPEKNKDEVLEGQGQPIDIPPGSKIRDNARENTGNQNAKE